jgi:CHAT domain-containing protein
LLGVRPLTGAAATEAAIRTAKAPILLHIATHGVFLDEQGAVGSRSTSEPVGPQPPVPASQVIGYTSDLSLSRTALVLAGANHAADADGSAKDGLLTGEEARALNLFGTELVVLSACDTGLGSIKAGQGVYGLRHAFFVAGAETVVMSLWPVSDARTHGLMKSYYRLLLDGKNPRPRVRGLHEAMRLVKAQHPHPYYWAPFIATGRDAPLTIAVRAPRSKGNVK